MKNTLIVIGAFVVFTLGMWAGGIDWSEWLGQLESGRVVSIGNQMSYEKVSLAKAYEHNFEQEQRGYYTGWHDCEEKVGHKVPHPPIAYTLDEAKEMAGYK